MINSYIYNIKKFSNNYLEFFEVTIKKVFKNYVIKLHSFIYRQHK